MNLHLGVFFKEFLNEFPLGRMDRKGFLQYYEQVKDPSDKNSILCEYRHHLRHLSLFIDVDSSHVFAVFDKDHDGTIDFHEFVLTVAAGYPGDLHSHLSYIFDMWDSPLRRTVNSIWPFVLRCDVSGDGQLEFQEVASFLKTAVRDHLTHGWTRGLSFAAFRWSLRAKLKRQPIRMLETPPRECTASSASVHRRNWPRNNLWKGTMHCSVDQSVARGFDFVSDARETTISVAYSVAVTRVIYFSKLLENIASSSSFSCP